MKQSKNLVNKINSFSHSGSITIRDTLSVDSLIINHLDNHLYDELHFEFTHTIEHPF